MSVSTKLRVNGACHVTSLSRNTLYRYMKSGSLPFEEVEGVRWLDISDLKALAHKNSKVIPEISTSNDVSALSQEIHALTEQLTRLCNLLESQSDNVTVKKRNGDTPIAGVSDNERRAKEAQDKVWAVLEQYKTTKEPMPSIRAMSETAGVERGTFAKHKRTWESQNVL